MEYGIYSRPYSLLPDLQMKALGLNGRRKARGKLLQWPGYERWECGLNTSQGFWPGGGGAGGSFLCLSFLLLEAGVISPCRSSAGLAGSSPSPCVPPASARQPGHGTREKAHGEGRVPGWQRPAPETQGTTGWPGAKETPRRPHPWVPALTQAHHKEMWPVWGQEALPSPYRSSLPGPHLAGCGTAPPGGAALSTGPPG